MGAPMGYPMNPMPMQTPMMPVMEYPMAMPQMTQLPQMTPQPYMALTETYPSATPAGPTITMKVSPKKT